MVVYNLYTIYLMVSPRSFSKERISFLKGKRAIALVKINRRPLIVVHQYSRASRNFNKEIE